MIGGYLNSTRSALYTFSRAQMLTNSLLEKALQLASQILAASTLREGVAEGFPCSACFPWGGLS